MNSLTDLAANPLVHRLGWALVHSLWQMAAVAAALAVAMAIVPRRRANVRYACACAALVAGIALFAGTFAIVTPPATPELAATNHEAVPPLATITAGLDSVAPPEGPRALRADPQIPAPLSERVRPTMDVRPQSPSLLQEIASTLQPAIPWLVLLWTLGVLLVGLWHTGGIALTWRLRRLGGELDAGEHVLTVVRETAQRLGIRRAVRVLACARSAGPAVVGALRPVILLPAALLSGLTPAQLAALIAHELAHVRRWDYLANLVQVAIESVLFYHPATWWIGRVIRRERESCCDDLAVSAGPNRYDYARALAAVADHGREAVRPRFAMAAEGGSLMQRIQRLLAPSTTRRGDLLRRSALVGLLTVALAAAIVGCSLSGPKADAGTSTPSIVKPPQMRIAAIADANGQYIVEFRLPDGSSQPRLCVQAGKLARMTIGRDAAEIQSIDVTVTPDGKQVRVTYHVILAVKGGFRQWTQRNIPWPLGESKDLAEGFDFDAAAKSELLGVWKLVERNGGKVDAFAASAIDAAGNFSTVEIDAAGKAVDPGCQLFPYAMKPGNRILLDPNGAHEAAVAYEVKGDRLTISVPDKPKAVLVMQRLTVPRLSEENVVPRMAVQKLDKAFLVTLRAPNMSDPVRLVVAPNDRIGAAAGRNYEFEVTVTETAGKTLVSYRLTAPGACWQQDKAEWKLGAWSVLGASAADIRPVREARTQNEAIRLARADDLPAIEQADGVTITRVLPPNKKEEIAITDAPTLKKLREAMTVQAVPPSAGETQWQIEFYRGKELLRTAWVYPYGEWGFQRPKAPNWTCGTNDALPKVIGELLAKPATQPAKGELTDPARAKRAPVVLRVRKFSRKLDGIEPTMESYEGGKKLPLKFEQLNLLQVLKNEGLEKGLKPGGYLVVKYDERDTGLPDGEFTAYLVADHPASYKPGIFDYCFIGDKAFADQKVAGNCKEGISNVEPAADSAAIVAAAVGRIHKRVAALADKHPALKGAADAKPRLSDREAQWELANNATEWGKVQTPSAIDASKPFCRIILSLWTRADPNLPNQPVAEQRTYQIGGAAWEGYLKVWSSDAKLADMVKAIVAEELTGVMGPAAPVAAPAAAPAMTEEQATERLLGLLKQKMPRDFTMAEPEKGKQTPWYWSGEACPGVLLRFMPKKAVGLDRKPVDTIHLWVMDKGYTGRQLPQREWTGQPSSAPAEIAQWRGRRVLTWGDDAEGGWKSFRADLQAALEATSQSDAPGKAAANAADVIAAEADIAVAEKKLTRAREMVRQGIALTSDLDQAEADVQRAKLRLELAKADTDAARNAVNVKLVEVDVVAAERRAVRARELLRTGIALTSDLDQAEADVQRAKLRLELAKADTDAARKAVIVKLAEVDLAAAERRLERVRQLLQKGVATKAEFDDAQAALERAKVALERAKAGTGAMAPATQPGAATLAVYARIILPADKPVAGGVPVEPWIVKDLTARGKANIRAVCPWVRLDEKGAKKYDTDIWDGVLDGNHWGCPVGGSVQRTADGNATVETSGFEPFVVKVDGAKLPCRPGSRAIADVEKGLAYVALHVGPPGALTRSELIEFANEQAKKAYRKKHALASDAPVADFDRPRKPGGPPYYVAVYPDGENWRVIFILSLGSVGGHTVENRVEVLLDQAGTPAEEVKFLTLKDGKPDPDEGAKGPEGSAGAAKPKAVPPATGPAARTAEAPAVYAKVIYLLKNPPREKDRPEAWIAKELAARGHKNFMAVSGWVRLSDMDANKSTPIWDGNSDWFDGGSQVWGCSVGKARIIDRTADGNMTVEISSFMSASALIRAKVADKSGSRAITVVDDLPGHDPCTYVALHVGPPNFETHKDGKPLPNKGARGPAGAEGAAPQPAGANKPIPPTPATVDAELLKGQKVLMNFHAYPVGTPGPGQDNTAARKKVAEEIKAAIEKAGASVVKVLRDDDGEARSIHLWQTLLIDCGRADPNEALGKLPHMAGAIVFRDGKYVRGLADPKNAFRAEPMAAGMVAYSALARFNANLPTVQQLREIPGVKVEFVPPPMGSGGSGGYAIVTPQTDTALLRAMLSGRIGLMTQFGLYGIRDGGKQVFAINFDRKTVAWTAKVEGPPAQFLISDGNSLIASPGKQAFDLKTGKSVAAASAGAAELTREKLIELANEEARKAYCKKHGLAIASFGGNFDRARRPDGAVYDTRVEADGENQRVIFTVSLTIAGRTTVNRTEVVLDKAGKLVGEVKFQTLKDAAPGLDGGAKGPTGAEGATKPNTVPPATGPASERRGNAAGDANAGGEGAPGAATPAAKLDYVIVPQQATIGLGESIVLTARLTNRGERPVTVYWDDYAFEDMYRFEIIGEDGKAMPAPCDHPTPRAADSVTHLRRLVPGETLTYEIHLGSSPASNSQRYYFRKAGKLTVRASFASAVDSAFDPNTGAMASFAGAWTGRVGAAPVRVAVEAPPGHVPGGVSIAGQTVDANGAAVAGAIVELSKQVVNSGLTGGSIDWPATVAVDRAATDPNGRFAFNALDDDCPVFELRCAHPEYLPAVRTVIAEPPRKQYEVRLSLETGLTARGRVMDAAGKPVAGARVTVCGVKVTFADAAGRFAVRGVPRRDAVWCDAWRPGFVGADSRTTPAGAASGAWTIVLRRNADLAVTGVATLADGTPVAQSRLRFRLTAPDGRTPESESMTDANGRFRLILPDGGPFGGEVRADGPARQEVVNRQFHPELRPRWRAVLPKVAPGTLNVVFRNTGVIEAAVRPTNRLPEKIKLAVMCHVGSDQADLVMLGPAGGVARFQKLTPGRYRIRASVATAEHWGWDKEIILPDDANDLRAACEFALPAMEFGGVKARVFQPDGNTPLGEGSVWLDSTASWGSVDVRAGLVEIDDVPAGRVWLTARVPGLAETKASGVVRAGQTTDLGRIVLKRLEDVTGLVRGRILYDNGSPALGAAVMSDASNKTPVAADGAYQVRLPAGAGTVAVDLSQAAGWSRTTGAAPDGRVTSMGQSSFAMAPVEIQPGKIAVRDIVLPRKTLGKLLVEWKGAGKSDAWVMATAEIEGGYLIRTAFVADATPGTIEVPDVPLANMEVRLDLFTLGFSGCQEIASGPRGAAAVFDAAAAGSITVRPVGRDGKIVRGVEAYVGPVGASWLKSVRGRASFGIGGVSLAPGRMAKTRHTLDDGTAVFTGLGRGRYVVSISPESSSQPKVVQVEPGRQTTVDLPVVVPEQPAPATAPAGSQPAPPASPVPATDKRGAGAPDANGQFGPSGVFGAAQTYKLVGEVKFTTLKDAAGGMDGGAKGPAGAEGTTSQPDQEPKPLTWAERYVRNADARLDQGEYQGAINSAQTALRFDANNARAKEIIALAQAKLKAAEAPAPATRSAASGPAAGDAAVLPPVVEPFRMVEGHRLKLQNETVNFGGKALFLPSRQSGALPWGLHVAFSVNAEGDVDRCHLVRLDGRKVLQAVQVDPTDTLVVADLDADGTDEVITESGSWAKAFPKAKIIHVNLGLFYSDGTWSSGGGGISSNHGTVFGRSTDGRIVELFAWRGSLGASSLGQHVQAWADLYGDGRPVACELTTWRKDPYYWRNREPPTRREITSYWRKDASNGRWIQDCIHLPIPDDMTDISGLLNPRTFRPTLLMQMRDALAGAVPKGWTASIDDFGEIHVRSERQLAWRVPQSEALQRGEVTLSVQCHPRMTGAQREEISRNNDRIRTELDKIRQAIGDVVNARHEARTPEEIRLRDRRNELFRQLRPLYRPDIVTAEHDITIGISTMSRGAVIAEPADAREVAQVEQVVRQVLTKMGGPPKASPATQAATAPAARPAPAPETQPATTATAQAYAARIKPLLLKGWAVTAEKNVVTVTRAEPVEWYGTISLPMHRDKAELKAKGFVQSGAYTITAKLAETMTAAQAAAIAKENERVRAEYERAHPRPANAKPTAPPKELTDQLKPVPNVLAADCSAVLTASIEPPLAFYDDTVAAECAKVLKAVRGAFK